MKHCAPVLQVPEGVPAVVIAFCAILSSDCACFFGLSEKCHGFIHQKRYQRLCPSLNLHFMSNIWVTFQGGYCNSKLHCCDLILGQTPKIYK